MYNLRYHIASLVGVFLALALGLVLGGLVVQRGTVDRQQGALVAGLRSEFATLRADNRELTNRNEVLTAFSADMTDAWAAGRLTDKNVVLLTTAGRSDGLQAATEAVRAAGGNPIVVTVSDVDFALADDDVRSAVASGSAFSPELVASVATSLAAEWTGPAQTRPLTRALVDAGALTVEGLDPGMEADALVDVASIAPRTDAAPLAVASAFERGGAPAVVAQTPTSKSTAVVSAAERELSAFDTLGTEVGRYTLVALLTGAEPGFYGTHDAAVAPYPPLPE